MPKPNVVGRILIGDEYSMTIKCWNCGNLHDVTVKSGDFANWKNGALIQDVMGYLSSGDRELLISGTCDDCFGKMFA